MNPTRAEQKQIKKDALKAKRKDSNKNFTVIAKSIQNIIQLSRNEVFQSTSLRMLRICNQSEIDRKIFELLNKNYSKKES